MAGSMLEHTDGHLGPQYLTSPVSVSLSTTTARSTPVLAAGLYELECDEDCFFLQGGSTVTAALTDVPLAATATKRFVVTTASNGYVAGILASGTATLTITKIG